MALKGGIKLRRCAKKSGYYQAQFARTTVNKERRLLKRLAFDPSAASSIKRLRSQI